MPRPLLHCDFLCQQGKEPEGSLSPRPAHTLLTSCLCVALLGPTVRTPLPLRLLLLPLLQAVVTVDGVSPGYSLNITGAGAVSFTGFLESGGEALAGAFLPALWGPPPLGLPMLAGLSHCMLLAVATAGGGAAPSNALLRFPLCVPQSGSQLSTKTPAPGPPPSADAAGCSYRSFVFAPPQPGAAGRDGRDPRQDPAQQQQQQQQGIIRLEVRWRHACLCLRLAAPPRLPALPACSALSSESLHPLRCCTHHAGV